MIDRDRTLHRLMVPVVPVPLPHKPELPALAPPVVVHLVVEPEVPVHLCGGLSGGLSA